MRYKIVNVVAFAILNAFTLRKEEDEDFVVGGVLLLTVVLFKDDEKRAVDKDTTEFETIIYISFKLSFCCLEVVCAGIYFDLKNKGYSLSACLSTKGVLSYLKPYKP